jgi:hypothetical protein
VELPDATESSFNAFFQFFGDNLGKFTTAALTSVTTIADKTAIDADQYKCDDVTQVRTKIMTNLDCQAISVKYSMMLRCHTLSSVTVLSLASQKPRPDPCLCLKIISDSPSKGHLFFRIPFNFKNTFNRYTLTLDRPGVSLPAELLLMHMLT